MAQLSAEEQLATLRGIIRQCSFVAVQVADYLLETGQVQVVDGERVAKTVCRVYDIARSAGVSKKSVYTALQDLQIHGALQRFPGRGHNPDAFCLKVENWRASFTPSISEAEGVKLTPSIEPESVSFTPSNVSEGVSFTPSRSPPSTSGGGGEGIPVISKKISSRTRDVPLGGVVKGGKPEGAKITPSTVQKLHLPRGESLIHPEAPDPVLAEVVRLYEDNITLLSPLMAEELKDFASSWHEPIEWIREAFLEAVSLNKRNWKYIRAILERWQREGYCDRTGRRAGEGTGLRVRGQHSEEDPDRGFKRIVSEPEEEGNQD